MKLEIASFQVNDVAFSDSTRYSKGVLHVDREELRRLVVQDDHFIDADVCLVRPGDKARIINVLDVVEPRHKVSGPGTVFPGVLGPPITAGRGRDHSLKGMAVVTTSAPAPGESVHWRDGIIDMWGPGARYSPFSSNLNLVVQLKGKEDFSAEEMANLAILDVIHGSRYSREYNRAARGAGFRIADYLASVTGGLRPDREEVFEICPAERPLPKVVYSCQVQYHYLYGAQIGWQPTLVHPNEILDGALYISFMDIASDRESTLIFQNHPVIRELYGRHGADIDFRGVLLYRNGGQRIEEKERITGYGAKLLSMLGIEGAVMTWNGGGHPGIDVMMQCEKYEKAGIKTTLLNPQMALSDDDPGFVHYVPEADAIVNTGNYEKLISLPPAKLVLGGVKLSTPEIDASGSLSLSLRYIYCATAPTGISRLGSVLY